MGGLFGVASKADCVSDLFFGTDYHSHLGTRRGGLAVRNAEGFTRFIHDISNAQFRSKFETDIGKMDGNLGIGVISEPPPTPVIPTMKPTTRPAMVKPKEPTSIRYSTAQLCPLSDASQHIDFFIAK